MNKIEIPVNYEGLERCFPAIVQRSGYVYKLLVDIDGEKVVFEQDEEGAYRAMSEDSSSGHCKVKEELLKSISEVLDKSRK